MIHPKNRLERRRSAEAKSLRNFKHKVIDGKKREASSIRHKKQALKAKEYQDELHHYEVEPVQLPKRQLDGNNDYHP